MVQMSNLREGEHPAHNPVSSVDISFEDHSARRLETLPRLTRDIEAQL